MARAPDRVAGGDQVRAHERALAALARRGRLRSLVPERGLDFTSNDTLGLAASLELRDAALNALSRGVPVGAAGSRLLRGNHREHEALEREAAAFFGSQAALYFGGGFSANSALLGTLPARGDLIVHDELIHASAWEGMALTKAACVGAAHNDVAAFDAAIAAHHGGGGVGRVWIAIESLYSMDGDVAPIADFVGLADRRDAMLVIDEAHATGVWGDGGRGLGGAFEGRDNVIGLHTCGKALGASGALVTCAPSIRDFLVNRARGFIYATAPSPLMAAIVRRSLQVVADQPERRSRLAELVAAFGERLEAVTGLVPSGTHIQPIIVGADARAVAMAAALQAQGFDVRAIRPPTVPEGTARLRIALTLNVSEVDGARLVDAIGLQLEQTSSPSSRSTTEGQAAPRPRRDGDTTVVVDHAPRRSFPSFVVTGTGTGVGKTVFAAGLVAALDGAYWKPVQAGVESDTERVRVLSGLGADRFFLEAYQFATAASPHEAAAIDGVAIVADALSVPACERALVIEGAGGLMVPLSNDALFIDVFERWQVPVILVASTGLGTINHTLLSLEALRSRGVPLHGVVFVGDENLATQRVICDHSGVRALGRLPRLEQLDRRSLREAFATAFDMADFVAVGVST
jgi:8-amino-7-oxononanoate synthase